MNLLLLALGFANAAILGWLAAAAAPILIHLWMKRVRRETPWAAVRFLQAAIKRHARRLRLQEWLLLAIRTAIILLVVFAASKPLLESLGGLLGGARTHRVLVIDASLSMQQQTESEGSAFERAKALAREVVQQSSPGDSFSLCVLADPVTTPIGEATTDAGAVRRAIALLEPTHGTADLAAALARVMSVLENAEQVGSAAVRREVMFFTDLAVGTWRPAMIDPSVDSAPGDAAGFDKLAQQATLSVVDVGGEEVGNAAAAELQITSGTPTLRQPARVRGSLKTFGASTQSTGAQMVELLVDGVAVESREVELQSGEPLEIEFNHRFRRPGWRKLSIRLAGDALAADDQRYLAAEVKPYVRILCVEGARDAARYVADALNPTRDGDAPIQARVVSDAELAAVDLAEFDSIFVCNVAEFSPREAERLNGYVRGGGGLIFFLGDRVRPKRYNAILAGGDVPPQTELSVMVRPVLFQKPTASPLLPVILGEPVSQTGSGVDPLEYAHPIVAPFRGRERAGLLTTPVERYFRMRPRPTAKEAATVIATLTGDPLMVAAAVQSGRVVVVATAASLASVDPATGRPWTAMPAWPSFVPIVRELVRYTSGADLERRSLLVGEALAGRVSDVATTQLEVARPDDSREALAVPAGDATWQYDRTDLAGFYAVGPTGAQPPQELLAVNVPTSESDLTQVAASALPAELQIKRNVSNDPADASDLAPSVGIHHGLLMAALGLVLLETILACRFGRGAA